MAQNGLFTNNSENLHRNKEQLKTIKTQTHEREKGDYLHRNKDNLTKTKGSNRINTQTGNKTQVELMSR